MLGTIWDFIQHNPYILHPSCSVSVVAKVVGHLLFTAGSLIHYRVSPVGVVVDTLGLWQSFYVSMLLLLCPLFSVLISSGTCHSMRGLLLYYSPLPLLLCDYVFGVGLC